MKDDFSKLLEEELRNPEFKKEWDSLDPEFQIIKALYQAREEMNLTQKELSERTGISQSDISKLETGNANPTIRTLQRLAEGMGMTLKIEFLPTP